MIALDDYREYIDSDILKPGMIIQVHERWQAQAILTALGYSRDSAKNLQYPDACIRIYVGGNGKKRFCHDNRVFYESDEKYRDWPITEYEELIGSTHGVTQQDIDDFLEF